MMLMIIKNSIKLPNANCTRRIVINIFCISLKSFANGSVYYDIFYNVMIDYVLLFGWIFIYIYCF